jgi:hypothetical protein
LVTKLPKAALQTLVDRVVDRLPVLKGRLMHHSGHLALIKSALTTIPIYTSISIGLPTWMHNALQKIMMVFLLTDMNMVQQGNCLVAWKHVQRPLRLG